MTCYKCGTNNAGGAVYCSSCGATLAKGKKFGVFGMLKWFVGVAFVGAILIGGCGYSGYRKTVGMDEGVKAAWADVEVDLERRMALIPNIVETVKGYAKHEKELLQGIADARKAYTGASSMGERAQADSELSGFLSRLLVIQERYPELKADKGFRELQISLEGTENRLAEKRRRYNDAVKNLNAYIRAFPGSMYAGWLGVEKAELFKANESAREAPKVTF